MDPQYRYPTDAFEKSPAAIHKTCKWTPSFADLIRPKYSVLSPWSADGSVNYDLMLPYKIIHNLRKRSLSHNLILHQFNKNRRSSLQTGKKAFVYVTFTSTFTRIALSTVE